jgi:CysZ protein
MFEDALDAFAQIFTPPFRATLYKSLALTLALLALAWYGLDHLIIGYVAIGPHWVAILLSLLTGLGILLGLAFLIAPITTLVAGFFLDDIAAIVEREIDPSGVPGRNIPAIASAWFALRFAGLSIIVNIIALVLLLAPGVNIVAFFGANGYLFGREYFELAAMRYRSLEDARAMRRHYELRVFLAGLLIAAFVAVPLLNLFTPLFATALMTRLHRRLSLRGLATT